MKSECKDGASEKLKNKIIHNLSNKISGRRHKAFGEKMIT
jgi:hypothetical protein